MKIRVYWRHWESDSEGYDDIDALKEYVLSDPCQEIMGIETPSDVFDALGIPLFSGDIVHSQSTQKKYTVCFGNYYFEKLKKYLCGFYLLQKEIINKVDYGFPLGITNAETGRNESLMKTGNIYRITKRN